MGRKHSQRLETGYPELGCEQPGEERQDRRAGLPDAGDVAHAAGQEPPREDRSRLVHQDGVHGAQDQPDERDRDCVLDERGHDPDGDFQPACVRDQSC